MGRFAESTTVDASRSREELERIVTRYGASAFMYGWDGGRAIVQFRASGRFVKFELEFPERGDFRFTDSGNPRTSADAITKAWEQATRQRWRALTLVVKAKLEAVASGITTFDEEFLAHIVLPGGGTVGDTAVAGVALAYETGEMPLLLPESTA